MVWEMMNKKRNIFTLPQKDQAVLKDARAIIEREAATRRSLDLSGITGARHAVVLGAIYPGN